MQDKGVTGFTTRYELLDLRFHRFASGAAYTFFIRRQHLQCSASVSVLVPVARLYHPSGPILALAAFSWPPHRLTLLAELHGSIIRAMNFRLLILERRARVAVCPLTLPEPFVQPLDRSSGPDEFRLCGLGET
ncbi:hypothetical protein XH98_20845 [Bradyrhizobium sp. CCBAU 51745]|uniref:hypothetical protein n=1 Tax=Bradyrhizobium sp. CCBAU 51745 TaxID=1325099 RepID=UPI002306A2E4|nr:hypothetical protein [Bradyrhizobium sp. CCBAU 51745]MDA9441488.1 hypothetical protein [Bradyrhizobium sp. CCBAU 51745]